MSQFLHKKAKLGLGPPQEKNKFPKILRYLSTNRLFATDNVPSRTEYSLAWHTSC